MIVEKELAMARRIGYRIGSRWSAIEIEDVQSELVLWLFENAETVERYREEEGGEGKLYLALRRKAAKYCAREQAARSGAPIDHDAEYTIEQIERAMPFLFEDTPVSLAIEDPRSGAPIGNMQSEYGLGMAILMDLRGAFRDMPRSIQEILEMRFRAGLSYDEIAQVEGTVRRTAQRRVERALTRMRDHVCGYDA